MTGEEFVDRSAAFGVDVSEEAVQRLAEFEERLYRANETTNLTRVPRDQCWERHFLDSLALSLLLESGSSLIDLGSGPGFPGVPLAITRPDLRVTLLEAASKEMRFLESLHDLASFGLIFARAEEAARSAEFRGRYDAATGRAFAPLSVQAEVSVAFVRVNGLFLPMRTAGEAFPSLDALGLSLELVHAYTFGEAERAVPVYSKTADTPKRLPRSWAAMKRDAGNLTPDESR